jgi:hypothetical protein
MKIKMNKIKQKIIDLCMDDSLNGEALVIALEEQITEILPFNHNADTDLESCGITDDHVKFSISFDDNSMSKIIEKIENVTTKRKLAIAFFHNLVKSGDIIEDTKFKKSHSKGETIDDQLAELIETLFSNKDSKKRSIKFDDFMKGLFGGVIDDENPSPDYCRAEDNSDCWKCKSKNICTKFTK